MTASKKFKPLGQTASIPALERKIQPLPPHWGDGTQDKESSVPVFWGQVYGVTGERVGTGYMGNSGGVVIVAPPVVAEPLPDKEADEWIASRTRDGKRRRIFIGEIQDCWNLSSSPDGGASLVVGEMEGVDVKPDPSGKGKGKARDPSLRTYIGDPKVLLAHSKPSPLDPGNTAEQEGIESSTDASHSPRPPKPSVKIKLDLHLDKQAFESSTSSSRTPPPPYILPDLCVEPEILHVSPHDSFISGHPLPFLGSGQDSHPYFNDKTDLDFGMELDRGALGLATDTDYFQWADPSNGDPSSVLDLECIDGQLEIFDRKTVIRMELTAAGETEVS